MKRFYPLSVDRLEDRCVPTVVVDLDTVAITQAVTVDVSTDPTAGAVVVNSPIDNTSYVIDVYPTDPNGLPGPTVPGDVPVLPGDPGWSDPTEPVPPIDDPFWL